MKYIVKTPYFDLTLEKAVEADEVIEADEARVDELEAKGIILEKAVEAPKEPKATKVKEQ